MKKIMLHFLFTMVLFSCKNETKASILDIKDSSDIIEKTIDEDIDKTEITEVPIKKSIKQLKEELIAKGFKIKELIDDKTQDTILMQQYFMVFLKIGDIHGQNEEETAELQEDHLAYLTKMYELGYADISGPFGDDGNIRDAIIYNVPTFKMVDSLAKADPMVKARRLKVEIHPWWVGKGFPLR